MQALSIFAVLQQTQCSSKPHDAMHDYFSFVMHLLCDVPFPAYDAQSEIGGT